MHAQARGALPGGAARGPRRSVENGLERGAVAAMASSRGHDRSPQAEKRAQQEEERKAKRKAKERDALQRSRAPRKKRVSVEPVQRRGKQKYPIDDALLCDEPVVELAERPQTQDPCVELLRGLPPDKVGDVLAIHALL